MKPVPDEDRRATAAVLFAFAFQAIYFTGAFPPFWNPNELSRLQTVVAMGEWKTFSIDQAIAALGDHEDKAVVEGRFYSNKAPGLAFAAYPVYALLRLSLPAPTPSSAGPLIWLLRLGTVTVACVIALTRLGVRLREGRSHPSVPALVTLAVGLGTPFLFYGRTLFSHAWAAALLFLAWDRLRAGEEAGARRPAGDAALSGLLAGWAVISEYTVAPIAVVLAVRALAKPRGRRLAAFAAAAALPLALLLAYNAACFGSPFSLSSAHEADPQYAKLADRGVFGIGVPNPVVAARYLLDPARGVLLFCPFLLWSVAGAVRWWRSGRDRADCLFVVGSVTLFFVALSGYPNWHGGWSLGSRYLIPAVLLAALPIGWALETPLSRGLFLAAAVFSVASHAILTATWAHHPPSLSWPVATASAWYLARGWIAQNLGTILGLAPPVALWLPVLVTGAVTIVVARAARPVRPGVAVAILAGAAPLCALLLRPPALSYEGRLWRAAALGAFSGRDPQREELRATAMEAATPEERRLAMGLWRVYGPPPPPEPSP